MTHLNFSKKSWDGYCQPGRSSGPRRLRMIALRLIYAESRGDWDQQDHYMGLWLNQGGTQSDDAMRMWESERACEVRGPSNHVSPKRSEDRDTPAPGGP